MKTHNILYKKSKHKNAWKEYLKILDKEVKKDLSVNPFYLSLDCIEDKLKEYKIKEEAWSRIKKRLNKSSQEEGYSSYNQVPDWQRKRKVINMLLKS